MYNNHFYCFTLSFIFFVHDIKLIFCVVYSVIIFICCTLILFRISSTIMTNKKCQFQDDWLQDCLFRDVIKKCKNNNFAAYCILCCKEIRLSNMGKAAIISHIQGKKHEKRIISKKQSYGIRLFTSYSKVRNLLNVDIKRINNYT